MTRSKVFHAREKDTREKIYQSLLDLLKTLSPSMLANRGSTQTMNDILGLAIDLHKSMRCSREKYILCKPAPHELGPRVDLKQWTLKLSDTWRTVAADENSVPYIGLIPGLYKERHSNDDSSRFELVKPVVVIGYQNELEEHPRAAWTPVDDRDRVVVEVERQQVRSPASVKRRWFKVGAPRSSTTPVARPTGPLRKLSM